MKLWLTIIFLVMTQTLKAEDDFSNFSLIKSTDCCTLSSDVHNKDKILFEEWGKEIGSISYIQGKGFIFEGDEKKSAQVFYEIIKNLK